MVQHDGLRDPGAKVRVANSPTETSTFTRHCACSTDIVGVSWRLSACSVSSNETEATLTMMTGSLLGAVSGNACCKTAADIDIYVAATHWRFRRTVLCDTEWSSASCVLFKLALKAIASCVELGTVHSDNCCFAPLRQTSIA